MNTISRVAVNDGGVLLRTCGVGFVLRTSVSRAGLALTVLCSEDWLC